MNEQQARALVDRLAAQVVRHQDASRRTIHPDAALVHDGWAAGLEEAAADLVGLLDGPEAVRVFRELLSGGPGRSIEDARAEAQVRHLSEKASNAKEAS